MYYYKSYSPTNAVSFETHFIGFPVPLNFFLNWACFRGRKLSIWLPKHWRNNPGGSIRSIWCGFRDTRNPKSSLMTTNRFCPVSWKILQHIPRFRERIFISTSRNGLKERRNALHSSTAIWKTGNCPDPSIHVWSGICFGFNFCIQLFPPIQWY